MPRYQLLAGQYICADLRKPIDKKKGKRPSRVYKATPPVVDRTGKLVQEGHYPVFESDSPECARDPRKFRRVDFVGVPALTEDEDGEPQQQAVAVAEAPESDAPPRFLASQLEAMTLEQLRELAADEDIDVAGATTKSVIIRLILAST